MKQVNICVVDGTPIVRWRETDIDDWANGNGKWMRYTAQPDERLGEHITRLYNATVSMPAFTEVVPDPESRQIPLVYPEAYVCQPKDFEYDWVQIIRTVQKITGDFDLEFLADGFNNMRGQAKVIIEQKEKRSCTAKKSSDSRYKHIPKPEALKEFFMDRMDLFGGMPKRGGLDKEKFWNGFQKTYEDSWPYDMEKHDNLPLRVIKDHCDIRGWTKEWNDLHGLIIK